MHRKARFFLIQTVALWFGLMLVTLTCTGLTQGEIVVLRALEHLGKPYVLGAAGPDRFDCSGLVRSCLAPEGLEFPVHAAALIGTDENYRLITRPRDLLPGDVVCFDTVRDRDPSDHRGFYMGANRFVHASSTGEVKISALEGYYLEKFTGARRYTHVYTALPTRRQWELWLNETGLAGRWSAAEAWLEKLDLRGKLAPVIDRFNGLRLSERLAPVTRWFDALDLKGKFAPVAAWFDRLDLPGLFDRL